MKKRFLLLTVIFAALLTAPAYADYFPKYDLPNLTCIYCGLYYDGIDWEKTKAPPTCQERGQIYYKCSSCGRTKSRWLDKSDSYHVIGEVLEEDVSCLYPGTVTSYCALCGVEFTIGVEGVGHDMVETSRSSRCDNPYYSVHYTCSRCGETETRQEPKEAVPHTWVIDEEQAPTCTSGGYLVQHCSVCSMKFSETIPLLEHTWTETRTEPSCTVPGSIISACSVCGTKQSESAIPALGHAMQEADRKAATCTVSGSIFSVCSRCNETETEEIPALGGECDWEETSRTAPTCLPGSIGYICSKCQDTKIEEIPALENAHEYEVVEIVPAEYDIDGQMTAASYIRYSCTTCHDEYNQVIGVAPTGLRGRGRR